MRYTEAPARREELLRRLDRDGYIASAAVADEFGVSEMTIRRDLRQLHLDGLARRVVGGASRPSGGSPFEERDLEASAEKAALAQHCADLLHGVATVALDAGTTAAAVAAALPPGMTVVSHSVPVISAVAERDDLDLIALGGTYQRSTRSFTGIAAREGLERVAVDVAVLSATAVDASGLLCANEADADMKRAMMTAAARVILVVDRAKLGARAPLRFGSLEGVDIAVTSGPLAPERMRLLSGAAEVHLVDAPSLPVSTAPLAHGR